MTYDYFTLERNITCPELPDQVSALVLYIIVNLMLCNKVI